MKHIFSLFTWISCMVFTAQSQSLVSISPSSGAVGSTVSVTISGNQTAFAKGTNFALQMGTSIIPVSGVNILSATIASGSVVIPSNAASGSYTLLATKGLGIPLQLPAAFTVTGGAPVAGLVSISPNSGNQGQVLPVTITGVNTTFTQSSNITVTLTSLLGGTPIVTPLAFAQNNTTLRTAIMIPQDAVTGNYALAVTTSNDGTLILPNAFTVNGGSSGSAELTGATPSSAKRGQTLNVTITGANTNFDQGSDLTVSLFNAGSPVAANFAFANTSTSLTANFTIPTNEPVGSHDIIVFSSVDGLLTLPGGFTVTSSGGGGTAQLVSVNPPYGHKGQTLDITITGTNTQFTQGSNALAIYNDMDGVEATAINVISDTEISGTFTIPDSWPNGLYNVGVLVGATDVLELPLSFSVVNTGIGNAVGVKQQLNIFPNPVTTRLNFASTDVIERLTIIDITGKAIEVDIESVSQSGSNTYSFDFRALNLLKGIYFLRVQTPTQSFYQKFIAE